MTRRESNGTGVNGEPPEIDTTVAHAARIYGYYLAGSTNFEVDRIAAEHAASVHPGGIDTVRASVRSNRAFLVRAVRWLAGEAGVCQFFDIGSGIPNGDNVHAVAQRTAVESRIVYVDNDPIVLAHAHELVQSTPEGAVSYIYGDLRDVDSLIERAARTLDFTAPVAVMLVGILHFFPDSDDPYGIVARLLEAVPSGSHLVVCDLASDIHPDEMAEVARRFNETTNETWALRRRVGSPRPAPPRRRVRRRAGGPTRAERAVNGFVVTYGPQPKLWCTSCRHDTTLTARLDGTLRPGDVEQAQRNHVCRSPVDPWHATQVGRAS